MSENTTRKAKQNTTKPSRPKYVLTSKGRVWLDTISGTCINTDGTLTVDFDWNEWGAATYDTPPQQVTFPDSKEARRLYYVWKEHETDPRWHAKVYDWLEAAGLRLSNGIRIRA
jgi:hypothetical protein